MTTTPQRSQEQTANIADQLCHQLRHQHAASAQTTEQAVHWISTHRNLSASFDSDIQALNLFRVETTSAILEIQHSLSLIDTPSWINKRRIDKLEEQNEDYRAQLSDLRAELALTKDIAIRALKRAKRSRHPKSRDTSPIAEPSQPAFSPTRSHSRDKRSSSVIAIKSLTSRSSSVEELSRYSTPIPDTTTPVVNRRRSHSPIIPTINQTRSHSRFVEHL